MSRASLTVFWLDKEIGLVRRVQPSPWHFGHNPLERLKQVQNLLRTSKRALYIVCRPVTRICWFRSKWSTCHDRWTGGKTLRVRRQMNPPSAGSSLRASPSLLAKVWHLTLAWDDHLVVSGVMRIRSSALESSHAPNAAWWVVLMSAHIPNAIARSKWAKGMRRTFLNQLQFPWFRTNRFYC
jgi:hypothetical protein